MKIPKLVTLLDDEHFNQDYINVETGLMITQYDDVATFLILEYKEYFHVFLNIDDEEHPFYEFIVEGIAETLEQAQVIAEQNLNELVYTNIN